MSFIDKLDHILEDNGCAWITFTFALAGSAGKCLVDDFYIDPIKHHTH